MSMLRLILVSLGYHWRSAVTVALGAAAGTAVLCGALTVGDSMRGSLRRLTIERLGRIDEALVTDRFFRAALADELAEQPEFGERFSAAVPAILLEASVEQADAAQPRRANQVHVIGCDARFWALGRSRPGEPLAPGETAPPERQIALNEPLAEWLGVAPGDTVILRLPRPGAIPAESALGRRTDNVATARLRVAAVAPPEGLGRFSLRPSQRVPRNAYVSLDWLAAEIGRPGGVNAVFVAGRRDAAQAPSPDDHAALQALLRPSLEDLGLRVEPTPRGYVNVTTDRMLLPPGIEAAILQRLDELGGSGATDSAGAMPGATAGSSSSAGSAVGQADGATLRVQPALTYLANTIACGDREIPYSTVTALDPADEPPLGPLHTADGAPIGRIGDDEIVLNSWAAEQLGAKPGDVVRLVFFEPESTHGRPRERSVELRLAAVAALDAAAADPHLTPEVPGVTDKLAIDEWDPPFPFDARRIRPQDEAYWDDHRATPKAFVSLATGRRLWASRFGRTTSLRIALPKGMTAEQLAAGLNFDPAEMGFAFRPVKAEGLAASAGTTPFGVLFLAFSFFVIAAAVMLVGLMFALAVERRAAELGILAAVGFARRRVAGWFLAEGVLISAAGGILGLFGGVGYAALMLHGLRTWWVEAVVTPFLQLHVRPASLAIGYAAGVTVATAAVALGVRRVVRVAPRRLLAGETSSTATSLAPATRRPRYLAWLWVLEIGLVGAAFWSRLPDSAWNEQTQVALFFAAGAGALGLAIVSVWTRLRRGATGRAVARGRGNLARLALRNVARFPGQSALVVGLVASATFLIASVGAFRADPTDRQPALDQGDGGFALVAESTQPIYVDLGSPEGRAEMAFTRQDETLLDGCKVFSLRASAGDDASCLNLYRPGQPRILGLPEPMLRRGGFAWAAFRPEPGAAENPWTLLELELGDAADGVPLVPVVLEKDTANYSLNLWRGVGETFEATDGGGGRLRLVVVGLLSGSILQGELLIGERAFLRYFPESVGYRVLLVECPAGKTEAVAAVLERALGDFGLAAETTGRRLAGFLAVQNTYLSTFQSLGGLGLVLGTFGLAAVQLRSVLRRRGELALMRAAGFRRAVLSAMILLETAALVAGGLAVGLFAALVAVLPRWFDRGAAPPWGATAAMALAVAGVGALSGWLAARAALAAPLLAALREEK